MPGLTHERLLEALHYSPATGKWHWKVQRCWRPAGTPAGSPGNHGYLQIQLDKVSYLSSRLAYYYMTGEWPKAWIDHRDGDSLNDRWDNLRDATPTQNARNRKRHWNNKAGVKGVHKLSSGRFRARVGRKDLGVFDTITEASEAYAVAAGKEHGEFARPL